MYEGFGIDNWSLKLDYVQRTIEETYPEICPGNKEKLIFKLKNHLLKMLSEGTVEKDVLLAVEYLKTMVSEDTILRHQTSKVHSKQKKEYELRMVPSIKSFLQEIAHRFGSAEMVSVNCL